MDTIHTTRDRECGAGSGEAPPSHCHQTPAPSCILGVEAPLGVGDARMADSMTSPSSAASKLPNIRGGGWLCFPGQSLPGELGLPASPRACEHAGWWAFPGNLWPCGTGLHVRNKQSCSGPTLGSGCESGLVPSFP